MTKARERICVWTCIGSSTLNSFWPGSLSLNFEHGEMGNDDRAEFETIAFYYNWNLEQVLKKLRLHE